MVTAAAFAAMPVVAQAQSLQAPGVYVGIEGGLNWMLNNSMTPTVNARGTTVQVNAHGSFNTGWAVGGMVGYDFVGPRVEFEGLFHQNTETVNGTAAAFSGSGNVTVNQTSVMANAYYDFMADRAFTPYIGAGVGAAFINMRGGPAGGNGSSDSVQFAYQGMIGVGYKFTPNLRLNLEGRYYGTTSPTFSGQGVVGGIPVSVSGSQPNNDITVLAKLQYKFGAPAEAAPPPPPPVAQAPSFMVFFDWDRSNLSQQALNTIKQAADQYKTKGNARITATGHTDRSGPENYNMALSLRRANAVKDALVRDGVPAPAITVIGKGESQPLVQTADGVREPQNRRVEIVLQ
jgi:outer membrane protein OmpA-like peptidoglycan-associated protein/outer membrane protein W